MQADDCYEQWRVPVARYEHNVFVAEAYNDPQLQPVVVLERLHEAWCVDLVLMLLIVKLYYDQKLRLQMLNITSSTKTCLLTSGWKDWDNAHINNTGHKGKLKNFPLRTEHCGLAQ